MSYANIQDLIGRFGEQEILQLTDRSQSGVINNEVAERALRDAAAEIDGYLTTRYTLPLATVPTVLVRLNSDMARYYLYDDHAPEQVVQRHKASVELLVRLNTGKMALGLSASGEMATSSDGAEIESGGRIWGRESSKGFI